MITSWCTAPERWGCSWPSSHRGQERRRSPSSTSTRTASAQQCGTPGGGGRCSRASQVPRYRRPSTGSATPLQTLRRSSACGAAGRTSPFPQVATARTSSTSTSPAAGVDASHCTRRYGRGLFRLRSSGWLLPAAGCTSTTAAMRSGTAACVLRRITEAACYPGEEDGYLSPPGGAAGHAVARST